MAANSNPKFTKNGRVSSVLVTALNASSQGGGTVATDMFLAFAADATNGSFVERVRLIPTATVATTTTATVARVLFRRSPAARRRVRTLFSSPRLPFPLSRRITH